MFVFLPVWIVMSFTFCIKALNALKQITIVVQAVLWAMAWYGKLLFHDNCHKSQISNKAESGFKCKSLGYILNLV